MDSRNPFNLGIIGCGDRARAYLRAGEDLFRCVACCDLRREAAEALRAEWHIGAAYTEARKLLRRNDLDVVALLTPTAAYAELIPAVAQAGKHIYLEGPLATTREAARAAIEACQAAAVHLGVVQPPRAWPRIAAAKRVLESGLLGAPFLARWETAHLRHWPADPAEMERRRRGETETRRHGDTETQVPGTLGTLGTLGTSGGEAGLLIEAVAPEIDLLCYLLQQPVSEVYARAGQGPFRAAQGQIGRTTSSPRETWAVLTLTFADGAVAQMFHSWDCQGEQLAVAGRFHLECAQGALFVNEEGPDTVAAYLAGPKAWLRPDLPPATSGRRRNMEEFLNRLAEGMEPEPPAPDQLYALEAVWAVVESLERHLPVAVQPLFPPEPAGPPEVEPTTLPAGPLPSPPHRPRRARLSPEDTARYAARLVPQPAPPVLVLSPQPTAPSEPLEEEEEPPFEEPPVAASTAEEAAAEVSRPALEEGGELPSEEPPAAGAVEVAVESEEPAAPPTLEDEKELPSEGSSAEAVAEEAEEVVSPSGPARSEEPPIADAAAPEEETEPSSPAVGEAESDGTAGEEYAGNDRPDSSLTTHHSL
jgi:predicted dehydrogenase